MHKLLPPLLLALLMLAKPVQAKTLHVVTDIAPVHSLVALVMQGVGQPELLVTPGATPHGYALRPSQARILQQADMVFWIGEALTPWLLKPLDNLAQSAVKIPLQAAEQAIRLHYRETGHDHADEHETLDPHMWLDPENAKIWLDLIAKELARIDPENGARYQANAAIGKAELNALRAEIEAKLAPFRTAGFLVFHDSYQYFETRFGLASRGTISLGDGRAPSAARIAKAREIVAQQGVVCVFSEPQFNAGVVNTVIEGAQVKTGVLDPLGVDLTIGAMLYPQLLRKLSTVFINCLS
ncbi:MAG: zinc ABC transporter substrate-binding protein [Rhodobacteraceae bacterium]|nr:zinc ABC transporter substrate-binding protein [Paracoccaceae bacterium]